MDKKYVIYGLYCTCQGCEELGDQIRYVGQTGVRMSTRFSQHKWSARNGKTEPVCRWIRKHGPENVRYRILDVTDDADIIDMLEDRWIEELGTRDHDNGGLNLAPGGKSIRGYKHAPNAKSRVGRRVPDEMRKRISETLKSRNLSGEKSPKSKLSNAQVSEILDHLWDGATLEEAAKRAGTTVGIVWGISTGKSYRDVPRPERPREAAFDGKIRPGQAPANTKLSREKVIEIRKRYDSGEGMNSIAADFGITGGNVSMIGRRKTWKTVPEQE